MSLFTRDFLGNNHSSKLPNDHLKTEKDYHQTCRSTNANRAGDQSPNSKLQELKNPLLTEDANLDLKLASLSTSTPPYTLGKVKFALERAEKEHAKKRSISMSKSFQETPHVDDEAYAAGCPSCLLYVLITSSNPRCPRCNMIVPSPRNVKKSRIDLSIGL